MSNWYDSEWPDDSGDFVLVDFDKQTVPDLPELWKRVEATVGPIDGKPEKVWLFATSAPRWLPEGGFPPLWKDHTSYRGGIPRNVWVGLWHYNEKSRRELPELLRIRARNLLLIYADVPTTVGELQPQLENWRCTCCGMRGVPPMPRDCPNTRICDRDTVKPQIHWFVPVVTIRDSDLQFVRDMRIAVWPERPES